jgi:hypothetical protein
LNRGKSEALDEATNLSLIITSPSLNFLDGSSLDERWAGRLNLA